MAHTGTDDRLGVVEANNAYELAATPTASDATTDRTDTTGGTGVPESADTSPSA